jgi:hypothetical protein
VIIFYAFPPNYEVIADTSNDESGIAFFTSEDLTVPGIPKPPKNSEKDERPEICVQVRRSNKVPDFFNIQV